MIIDKLQVKAKTFNMLLRHDPRSTFYRVRQRVPLLNGPQFDNYEVMS